MCIGYIDAKEKGLTGGLIKTAKHATGLETVPVGEAPKMFKIGEPTDEIKQFRVSKDATLAAVVLGTDEIHIYRLFDSKGDFLGDKRPLTPINKLKIRDPDLSKVIDLHFFKRGVGSSITMVDGQ